MKMNRKILYIHGMGGGADSRIPSILREMFLEEGTEVIARTYDFNPDRAAGQIDEWTEELRPCLVIGESLGAVHAMRLSAERGIPCILISPALNAPMYFGYLSWLTFIPGVPCLLRRIYKVDSGDRQRLHFTYDTMRAYLAHRKRAIDSMTACLSGNPGHSLHAFIGTRDHYRRSGIVSIRTWKRYFGEKTYQTYDGTHYTEEEYVRSLVADCIRKVTMSFQDMP